MQNVNPRRSPYALGQPEIRNIRINEKTLTLNHFTGLMYASYRFYCTEDIENALESFWTNLYSSISKNNSVSNATNISLYQDAALKILHDQKEEKAGLSFTDDELKELQIKIENLTTAFDHEKNMFQSTPDLIKLFICKNKPTAREYLKSRKLSTKDLLIINQFDQYTLEGVIIYVLSIIFSSMEDYPAVRAATLIEQLDSVVRLHASLLMSRNGTTFSKKSDTSNDVNTEQVKDVRYSLGVLLVEFLENRGLISMLREFNELTVLKKKKKYYAPMSYYVICNFDLSLLPIKLNLPMVYPPLPWESKGSSSPRSISDLSGGYLRSLPGEIFSRYRLLTSRNFNNFYIKLNGNYLQLCNIMNILQSQAFEINKELLCYINNNYDLLVKYGLLMPRFLSSLNLKEATDLLRKCYFQDQSVMKVIKFNKLLSELMVRVQRARFENFILKLASAYDGYRFYLPAFLDFRGRIYRSGILHFHERDLSKSLIVFSPTNQEIDKSQDYKRIISEAAAFHYQKFSSYEDAYEWYLEHKSVFNSSEDSLIQFAVGASKPFQFIRDVLCIEGENTDPTKIPITQDASASAYQLMSYFLLDKEIATQTNIIPSSDGKIQDVYTFILEELKDYLPTTKLGSDLSSIISARLTRKLIKRLFMPLIYGKTVIGMSDDIWDNLSDVLSKKECYILAYFCNQFWIKRFPGIINLIKLVSNVGWLCSAYNTPVYYSTPYFTTVQDYMTKEDVKIWVYNRFRKKRCQVTLRIPTENRDRRKTDMATFVNFIHQKDAWIAMDMTKYMIYMGAPVYTVHDNFITTAPYARNISNYYIKCLCSFDSPFNLINKFINDNLVDCKFNSMSDPIPLDYLKNILENKIPVDLSKSKRLTYDRRISSLLNAYTNYVNTMYNPKQDNYVINFLLRIIEWKKYKYNYCLHL